MSKNLESLNYSTQAIEDLLTAKERLNGNPYTQRSIQHIIDLLTSSVKFILPNKGALLDDKLSVNTIRQEWLNLTRLPYPVSTFEIPFYVEDGELETGEIKSSKRIALCWNTNTNDETIKAVNTELFSLSKETHKNLSEYPDLEGFMFLILSYIDQIKQWTFTPVAFFFPYESQIIKDDKRKVLKTLPINIFPEYAWAAAQNTTNGSLHALAQMATKDSQAEVISIIQACCTLNCQNIKTRDLAPPEKLNKKRVAKGKPALFTYKILEVSGSTKYEGPTSNNSNGHKSPAMHLRRGHLRHLSEDRVIWVRDTMVNATGDSKEAIIKEYAITPQKLLK